MKQYPLPDLLKRFVILETVLILFFRDIMMYFLLRQDKIDANSTSYLREFCSSLSEKDA